MTIINALPYQLLNGNTADASQVMADFNEILNDVNTNAAHNGANNDITSLNALTTPITPAQGGTTVYYGAGGGTANAQTAPTLTPLNFTLTAGYTVYWVPSVSNTGAMTLSVNGTTATAVRVSTASGLQPCIGGEVISGQLTSATYNGTYWCLDADPMVGFGTLLSLASATTTDLGTALSHTVNITGTTTITSFGSSASLQRPLYKLTFSGALILTYNASSLILPGSTSITTAAGDTCDALYLGSGNWQVLYYAKRNGQSVSFNPVYLQNYISGLTLSTAGSSGTMGIAAGVAADSTNAQMMLLNSAYTKTTASWAVGSGNGGLDTGAIANSTWYHFYEIMRPDTGVVDIIFSLSASAPAYPTNYTLSRRIGSGKTDGSAHWTAFTQVGDQFIWAAAVQDVNNISGTTARVITTLTVPPGIVVTALFRGTNNSNGANVFGTSFPSLLEADAAVTNLNCDVLCFTGQAAAPIQRLTNTSAQIGVRSSSSSGFISISTYGWIDTRGKT
jgi:hypothetical protein